ncbi:MAG: hypothetical protein ACRDHZ_20520 [Ktedonobacteraceae bacterium]
MWHIKQHTNMTRRRALNLNKPVIGTAPTEDDEFYIAWGRETFKNNISYLNDVLRQFITLNATLLGGSFVFLDDKIIDSNFKFWVLIILLASLTVAIIGIMPYGLRVDLRVASDIRRHKTFVTRLTFIFLVITAILLICAFMVALIGLYKHHQ